MSTLKLWPVLAFCMLVQSACIHRAGAEDVAASIGPDVEKYNIVWDSPSENSLGSMSIAALKANPKISLPATLK
jgi:hypothetical protein